MISKRSSLLVVVLVVSFLLICGTSLAASARSKTGLGIQYSGSFQGLGVPYLAGSFRSDQFGLGAGVGYTQYGTTASLLYYFLNGKYYIPVGGNLDIYTGGGITGASALVSGIPDQFNYNPVGLEGFAGVELSLLGMDLPITLRGGVDYVTYFQLGMAGNIGYHFGVELNF